MSNNTRDLLMHHAENYIRSGGFKSFSYRDLAKDLEIKNSSVHYHFPSKFDLGNAVIKQYNERFEKGLPKIDKKDDSVESLINHYIMMYYTEVSQTKSMCLCAVLSVEQSSLSTEMNESLNDFYNTNLAWLTSVFSLSKKIKLTKSQAMQRANFVLATLQGALIGANAKKDIGYFKQAITGLYFNLFDKKIKFKILEHKEP